MSKPLADTLAARESVYVSGHLCHATPLPHGGGLLSVGLSKGYLIVPVVMMP